MDTTVIQNSDLVGLVPLIPLAGFAVNMFFGERLGRKNAALVACGCVGFSFLLSMALFTLLPAGGMLRDQVYTWIESGLFKIEIAFQVDALTLIMLMIITGIGLVIHVYSLGYMSHDEGIVRFFAYLNLFIFFMLVLVTASNLLLLFVGWEGVGLCSYLLIGFWYQDHTNTIAANKAFIVNRIGDLGFLLAMLLLLWETGTQGVLTLDFLELERNLALLSPEVLVAVTLLLFLGATGKSAQIPLYVWLPDAMQGPTPVSALIHAATMVTAGVYLTARLHFLFAMAPVTLQVIAIIGIATALFAATIGLVQNDIKRVLAYSTVSQLGYMFLAIGVGAFSTAIFHVFTHAFFKACLFLGAGSVIHGLGGEQDMRKMGGLKRYFPVTYWTYLLAALAIAGAPLTAGFFSKDQILWQALTSPDGSQWFWLLGWITAGLTAFYMFRQFFMVFHGTCRVDATVRAHIHESPRVMTVPLVVLALGSVFAGWLGTPEFMVGSVLDPWLRPVFGAQEHTGPHPEVSEELLLMGWTVGIAALAIFLAFVFYGLGKTPAFLGRGVGYRLVFHKYYVDEIYDFLLVRPFTALSNWLAQSFDPGVIDRAVNGVASGVRANGRALRYLQSGNVQHYLLGFLLGTIFVIAFYMD